MGWGELNRTRTGPAVWAALSGVTETTVTSVVTGKQEGKCLPTMSAHRLYSVWLRPGDSDKYAALQQKVIDTSSKVGSLPFEPHVTLIGTQPVRFSCLFVFLFLNVLCRTGTHRGGIQPTPPTTDSTTTTATISTIMYSSSLLPVYTRARPGGSGGGRGGGKNAGFGRHHRPVPRALPGRVHGTRSLLLRLCGL